MMTLTEEQKAILGGSQGETMAKVMKTLVMYGETFNAQRLVPVTSDYGHTVISFGSRTVSESICHNVNIIRYIVNGS